MSNLQKEFVPYEIALKFKELGFDEECIGYFDIQSKELWLNDLGGNAVNLSEILLRAPLYQQVIDFFREEYRIIIHISIGKQAENSLNLSYIYMLYDEDGLELIDLPDWSKSYNDAREEAILKALILINGEC